MDIQDSLFNFQDAVIVSLLQEGFSLEDIIKVSISNVDFNEQTIYANYKKFTVSQKTLIMVSRAFHQDLYIYDNGESDKAVKLENSSKIFRGTVEERASIKLLKERIDSIEEFLGIELIK